MNLPEDAAAPLLGAVCRFTHQKGVDLLAGAAEELVALGAQICMLGRGERELEAALAAVAARYPASVAVAIGFNEDLAHLIEAGAAGVLSSPRFSPLGPGLTYTDGAGLPPPRCAR